MSIIKSQKDFFAGLLFILFSIGFLWLAKDYNFGSARRMGPAFFPIVLASALLVIGVIIGIRGVAVTEEPPRGFTFKGLVLVIVGTLLFGVLVRHAGVVVATAVLVAVSAFASQHFKLMPTLVLAVGLAAFCAVVFVYLLGLPMPIRGPWLGG
ncbi:tripartite tricarboxylate transporter TctB family protein [Pseudolabrys sp. FHR47]|uniref:tripartite tricarboxylate transporter TctB family protein n=1 Tax=Pseudolabrys sp. FHR47 TaxID=2562284 RepID=UPI0010BECC52|nr:tripartite tricarboxylate transporter TctB family protein [Pseudolabrys sp. FHR47]